MNNLSQQDLRRAKKQIFLSIQKNLNTKSVNGLNFVIIDDHLFNYINYLSIYDGIIVRYTKWSATLEFLKNIRTHTSLRFSFIPIFLLVEETTSIRANHWTLDGIISDLNLLDDISIKSKSIIDKIKYYENIEVSKFQFIANRTIQFLDSRNHHSIEPTVSRNSKLGYLFPYLSFFYELSDRTSGLKVIHKAEDRDWLNPEYIDSVYVCNNCEDGFLVYREVCPSCKSSNLQEQDIIHHFRCAHVGPLSEFVQDENKMGSLSCPKCYKELSHIGVDYDRPSVLQHCLTCSKDFQNYDILAKCTSCTQDTSVEHLTKKKIYRFNITPKGISESKEEIISGDYDILQPEIIDQPEWLFSKKQLHEHMLILDDQQRRISFLMIIKIDKVKFIDKVGLGKSMEIAKEIGSTICKYFGPTVRLAIHQMTFFLLVTETDEKILELDIDKIDLLLSTLLNDNLALAGDNLIRHKYITVAEYLDEWQEIIDLITED